MILASLSIILSLSAVTLGSVPEQEECGGPLSTIEFDDMADACHYYSRCTQPTHKLNANCILSSCPKLSGECPVNRDGSVNTTAVKSAVSILNTCIGQNVLICGINMSHTPIVQLGWTTKNLLPTNVVNGTVNLNPGTSFLDNLSCTTFTLIQTDRPIGSVSLRIQAPYITMKGQISCTFNLTKDSFLLPLKRQLTTSIAPDSLHTPNVSGTYNHNLSSTVSIDLCSSTINILDDQSDINIFYSNFVSANKLLVLPQYLVDLFGQGMQKYVKNSDVTSTTINFLSTYVAQGLQAAQLNCP